MKIAASIQSHDGFLIPGSSALALTPSTLPFGILVPIRFGQGRPDNLDLFALKGFSGFIAIRIYRVFANRY
jgi:hypothetical protein